MSASDSISPEEAGRLRGRRTALRRAAVVSFAGLLVVMFVWPGLSVPATWGLFAAYGVGLFVLHVRAALCPRCRHSVFVPRGVDIHSTEWDDADGMWQPIPARCRACGVGLGGQAADAEPGAAADGGGV